MKSIKPEDIKNAFEIIGKDWMLITAGDREKSNCMTASWGGLGVLWNKNVAFVFVRPVRHTYLFMEKHDFFSLSFFGPDRKGILEYCGKYSGRDVDKIKEMNLHPAYHESGAVLYGEASLSVVCRKIYYADIDPLKFLSPEIDANYPKKDYHRMYIGEITEVFEGDQKE